MKDNEAVVSSIALCCLSIVAAIFLIQQCAIEDIKHASTNSGQTLYMNNRTK